jgi:hypothetical protein
MTVHSDPKGGLMRTFAILAAFMLCAGGLEAAGGEKVTWMKFDAAQQVSAATGKPLLVYAGFT